MITAFLELKKPLIYINRNTDYAEFKSIFPSPLDWQVLKQLKRIFEVFVKATTYLQSEYYITVSRGLLFIYQIWKNLGNLVNESKHSIYNGSEMVCFFSLVYILFI